MLSSADRSVEDVVRFFSRFGVEAAYLVPTNTGMKKSIMDATGSVRDYLVRKGFHDYGTQGQGTAKKIKVRAWFVRPHDVVGSSVALYRPESKNGDPRIWFYGLQKYAAAGNLLAIFVHANELWVVNTSQPSVFNSSADPASPLSELLRSLASFIGGPSAELLSKLRDISSLGFIRSMRDGPTGVGMTLETMLGISANSRKAPDFKGIEIKAGRSIPGRTNRSTLFSKAPDWKYSKISSAVALIDKYGYQREGDGRMQLYCTLRDRPNPQGLHLRVDDTNLHAVHATGLSLERVIQWSLDGLRSALAEKHHETFWVKAEVMQDDDGAEKFHYVAVRHTRSPMLTNLETLLELGHMQVDLLMHIARYGATRVPVARDHGYLFKLHPRDLDLLFPPSDTYVLKSSERGL